MVNFAHGSLFVLGAFAASSCWAPAALLGGRRRGAVAGRHRRLCHRAPADPLLYERRSADDALLITFGFSLIVVDAVRMTWGKRGVEFNPPASFTGALDLGFTLFPMYRLLVIGFTLLVLAGLWLFLVRTDLGLVIRAGSSDPTMTRALGVRLDRARLLVFGLGAALAGLAGVLSGPVRMVSAEMGVSTVIEAFVVVVVGGMGSVAGAVAAGLLLGEVVSLTEMIAPTMGQIAIFLAMAVVLLVRPRGLLGEAGGVR
ncbi:MAG: branched-chain amino acid ABC transporter permease [Dongiaceae bacterium]